MELPLILVTVGTNRYPFARLDRLLTSLQVHEDSRVRWFFQSGTTNFTLPVGESECASYVPRERMMALHDQASIVIGHCGMGTIYNCIANGNSTWLAPRLRRYGEFSDDHQWQIASEIQNGQFRLVGDGDRPPLSYEQLSSLPRFPKRDPANPVLTNALMRIIEKYCP